MSQGQSNFAFNRMGIGGAGGRRSMVAGGTFDDSYKGNHFCVDSLVKPYKPPYPGSRSRESVFSCSIRVFPGKTPDGQFDVWRFGAGRADIGNQIACFPAWRNGGNPAITFFITSDNQAPIDQSPPMLLYNALSLAKKTETEGRGWAGLLDGETGANAVVVRPKPMFVMQGACFERFGKPLDVPDGLGEGHRPLLIEMSQALGNQLIRHWNELAVDEGGNIVGSPEDIENGYRYGDPVALDRGHFVVFYPKNKPRPAWLDNGFGHAAPAQGGGGLAPRRLDRDAIRQAATAAGSAAGEDRDKAGFDLAIVPSVGPWMPELDGLADVVNQIVRPWDQVLLFPTYEEQAALLAPSIRYRSGQVAYDVFERAWGDYPAWLPTRESDEFASYVGRESVQGSDVPRPQAPGGLRRVAPAPTPAPVAPTAAVADDSPPPVATTRPQLRRAGAATAPAPAAPPDQPAPAPAPAIRPTDFRSRLAPRLAGHGDAAMPAIPQAAPAPAPPSAPAAPGRPLLRRPAAPAQTPVQAAPPPPPPPPPEVAPAAPARPTLRRPVARIAEPAAQSAPWQGGTAPATAPAAAPAPAPVPVASAGGGKLQQMMAAARAAKRS